jgi:hypothetical protein
VGVLLIVIVAVFIWGLKWKTEAEKWRRLATTATGPATGGTRWLIMYKEGRKIQEAEISGSSESDAMKRAVAQGVPFDRVLSIERIANGTTTDTQRRHA